MAFMANGPNGTRRNRARQLAIYGSAALALAGSAGARPANPSRADLNGDDRIDRGDVVILLEAMLASVAATTFAQYQEQVTRADVNNDRKLSTLDLQYMLGAMGGAGSAINIPDTLREVGAPSNFLSQMLRPPRPPSGGGAGSTSGGTAPPPAGPTGGHNASGSMQDAMLGMNLDFVDYYTRQWVFVDVMKIAQPWRTKNAVWVNNSMINGNNANFNSMQYDAFTWDANGYPLKAPVVSPALPTPQIVETIIYADTTGRYPGGNYTCLYDGNGEIRFSGDATVISQTPGRMVVKVTPTNTGIFMQIARSSEGNHIRNVRLVMPGFENNYATQVFHPLFLERLQKFKTLRMLNWLRANNSTQESWADRPTTTYYTQGRKDGVALEHQIDLCNRLGANPWFTIPHLANDDYVRRFAQTVKARLRPDLKVYVEWSNEVWNGMFQQAHYATDRGLALNLSPDATQARCSYHALRSGQVFRLFEQTFGGTSRLVRVIASQHAVPWVSSKTMEFFVAHYGQNKVDALAVAPYFGGTLGTPQNAGAVAGMSVNQVLNRLSTELDASMTRVTAQKAVADRFNVRLVAYEAGQHLVGVGGVVNNNAITNLFTNTNRHPQMQTLLDRHLQKWRELGGGEYVALSYVSAYNKWGSWGYLEFQDQPIEQAHKFRSLTVTAAPSGN